MVGDQILGRGVLGDPEHPPDRAGQRVHDRREQCVAAGVHQRQVELQVEELLGMLPRYQYLWFHIQEYNNSIYTL